MKITLSWIKKHLDHIFPDFDLNQDSKHWVQNYLEQQILKFDSKGFPIEVISRPNEHLDQLHVATIINMEKHPTRSDLNILEVEFIDNQLQKQVKRVICGDLQLQKHDQAVLVLLGQIVPGTGKKLKARSIDGIISDGMLCSGQELALAQTNGVLVLNKKDYEVKAPLSNILFPLGNIYDIEITYNRGDLFHAKGLSRELAAQMCFDKKNNADLAFHAKGLSRELAAQMCFDKKNNADLTFHAKGLSRELAAQMCFDKKNEFINKSNNWKEINQTHAISMICSKECSFFSLSYFDLSNQKVFENKDINDYLQICSQITPYQLVNVSNFIMHDIGQPSHIFDAEQLKGSVHVRMSRENEEFVDLHNKTHSLAKDLLVIADQEGVIAVAGLIGGLRTSYTHSTKKIALEIAHFDPEIVLKSKLALNISTKSADFFTHSVDKSQAFQALELFQEITGLKCEKIEIDGTDHVIKKEIKISKIQAQQICGDLWDESEFKRALICLGFEIKRAKNSSSEHFSSTENTTTDQHSLLAEDINTNEHIVVVVPTYRPDIIYAEEVLSEYVRIKGYDQIKQMNLPVVQINSHINKLETENIENWLSGEFCEAKHLNLVPYDDCVRVINPMEGYKGLRKSILPMLHRAVVENYTRNAFFNGIFERGLVFDYRHTLENEYANEAKNKNLSFENVLKSEKIDNKMQDICFDEKGEYMQFDHLALVTFGVKLEEAVDKAQTALLQILHRLGINTDRLEYKQTENSTNLVIKGRKIGSLSILPHTLKAKVNFVGWELNLDALPFQINAKLNKNYHIIYNRDLSIKTNQAALNIIKDLRSSKIVKNLHSNPVIDVQFYIKDVYPNSFMAEDRIITVRMCIKVTRAFDAQELKNLTSRLEELKAHFDHS